MWYDTTPGHQTSFGRDFLGFRNEKLGAKRRKKSCSDSSVSKAQAPP